MLWTKCKDNIIYQEVGLYKYIYKYIHVFSYVKCINWGYSNLKLVETSISTILQLKIH